MTWTAAEREEARAMHAAGKTIYAIAKTLGKSKSGVRYALFGSVRPERPPLPRKRPCLCCGQPFNSTGPQHRLCNACRLAARDASPYAP
ncbi:MAG: helix-turn-helix domain-containing protein [Betaproteobacteria bacterium]|nr:helix-turn-helix domain-containing protein [Betaproteobacteria bacterium]MCL2886521.1 helix-turn-helix domain-containing protein [Betaproteobacteria bacterium]